MSKVWFITGCSSGFGRLLAERALEQGDSVIATARSVQALHELGSGADDRIIRLPLDVKNDKQIHDAVAAALEKFGKIDVLVNNAGYGYFATQEEGEMQEIREMFETNVFGLIAVSKAVIPVFRKQKGGVIVNLSSIAGRLATPRGGFYQSSKWAVEALSEAQYLELSSFGVRVVVIEPGSYDTDFGSRSARRAPAEDDMQSPYAELRSTWVKNARAHLFPHSQQPVEVIDGICEAVDSDIPFARLPIGNDALTLITEREEKKGTKFVEWLRKVYHEGTV